MLKFAARTDPGKKRSHNEDSYAVLPETGVFVVADGVGGRTCGEVASAMCVDAFRAGESLLRERLDTYTRAPSLESRNDVLLALDRIAQGASRAIYETAEAEGRVGMTTTLVAVATAGTTGFVCHVGDSRAYLIRGGEPIQLTEDHSMVNELVRSGKMSYEEARASRHRHVITRAVGLYPTVQPSLGSVDLLPGDRLLLCSDGLSDVVDPERVAAEASQLDLETAVDVLLRAALDRGGPDNITVVLADPAWEGRLDATTARAQHLENLFLFEDMPFAARLQVSRVMREHYFAPGDVLVEQGTPGTSMFIVLEGNLSVRAAGTELARLGPGEHFGELSLADNLPRSASVVATTFGTAVSLSSDNLAEFCRVEPELGTILLWKLLRVLGSRLRQTNALVTETSELV